MTEVDALEARRVQQRIEQRVDAGDVVGWVLRQVSHQRWQVARIDDQYVLPAEPREQQAVRLQREYVIERDSGNYHAAVAELSEARAEPRFRLQHVGGDVAV